MTTPLPMLDGSTEAAVARLDAWLDADKTDALSEALKTAKDGIDEALQVVTELKKVGPHSRLGPGGVGDVKFLGEELEKTRKGLAATIQDAELGAFATTADRIRRESA